MLSGTSFSVLFSQAQFNPILAYIWRALQLYKLNPKFEANLFDYIA